MSDTFVNIDADIERALTNFIRDKLNNNSFGITFDLGFWTASEKEDGSHSQFIDIEDNPYATEEGKYVPMTIESYDGNIIPIEGFFNVDYTLPITFQIEVDDPELMDNAISAINEFKNNLRGQLFSLNVDVQESGTKERFNMVTSTDNLTPVGDLEVTRSKRYAYATINLDFDISKDINYGNQVEIYLAEVDLEAQAIKEEETRIYALNPNFNRSTTTESFQNFGSNEIFNIVRESSYEMDGIMLVGDKDIHWNLVEHAVKKRELNKPYLLKMNFNRYDEEEGKWKPKFTFYDIVILTDANYSFSIGEIQYIEFVFEKRLITDFIRDYEEEGLPLLENVDIITGEIKKN